MAKFPIVEARQELGFTPTRSVRANIDVRTGEGAVGAAIGQGGVALTRQAIQKEKVKAEQRRRIEEKRRQMQDANSAVVAKKLRDTANTEFETFKLTNPQETWEDFRAKQATDVGTQVSELDFSPDAAETQGLKSEAYAEVETAKALSAATRQLRTDTIAAQSEAMTDAFRSGNDVDIAESTRRFADNGANMGKDRAEVLSDIKAAKEAGEKLAVQDAVEHFENFIARNPVDAVAEIKRLQGFKDHGEGADATILSDKELADLLDLAEGRVDEIKDEVVIETENALYDSFIKADEIDMDSVELRQTANTMRQGVKDNSALSGKEKNKQLKNIKTWEKDEGSINYNVINSLNQRIDQFIQSGVADQTLDQDIKNAQLDGSFGSRKGIVSRDSKAMLNRLDSAEYKTTYAATASIRADFKNSVRRQTNAEELMYLFDKDIREELSQKDLNDAQAFQFAQTRASMYKGLSPEQTSELIGVRAAGQDVVPWADTARKEQERDLFILSDKAIPFFARTETEVFDGWTKGDIKKAQEIWEGQDEVTDGMIKEFGDYLNSKEKTRFEAGSKLPRVTDDASYNKLPSGTVYMDPNGNKRIKN